MGSEDTVIDNENVILLDQLKEILPDTNRASIAVGYFFISGFNAIMNSLNKLELSDDSEHVIRLLISLTTNRATAEALLASNESYNTTRKNSRQVNSEEKGREATRNEVKRTLEYMSQTNEDQKAATKLVELIKKKKVQVKVYTKDQLHAKAYIFELDNRQLPKLAIVGSSNLSISGIKEHTELNLRTNHPDDSDKLLEWFDRHWNDPSCQEFTQEIADIIDESWIAKHSPNDVYDKAVFHEHGDVFDDDEYDDDNTRDLFDFQKTAVNSAIKKLDKYGGVMIADVVGTGKSYIGSAILKYLQESNRSKPLIICPPHLKEMWQEYMENFNIHCAVESRYKIGMDDSILSRYTNCDVVLVDESHNFRNSNTNAYKALLAFMEEKTAEAKIIMLSATPISNRITDLKNQLRLFPSEMLSQIPPLSNTNTTLEEYFKGLEYPRGGLREAADTKIRDLLKHILIRRTRKQIMEKYAKKDGTRYYLEKDGQRKYFPKRRLQNPEEYDVDKVYNNSFGMIQSAIENLKLARFAPGNYIKKEYLNDSNPNHKKYVDLNSTTKPLVGIVRTSLLKRMESSIKAFASSVKHYQEGYKEFKNQLDMGKVAIGKDFHDEIYKKIAYDGEDYDEEYKQNMASISSQYDIEAFNVEEWKKDITDDINRFSSIKGNLVSESEYTKYDDKLHTLVKLVNGMGKEKILIFSESAVTAEYICTYMKKELNPTRRIEQIDSKKNKQKNDLIGKFDPKNNNADIPQSDELDVLISTDVLSEGVNLQAGKTVINYDFHWNPVKLIQRVGRIDRIGTEHETVDIINFLPTDKIEIDADLSLKKKVSEKIETIRRIIGHDQQILESTEVLDSKGVLDIYTGNEDVLDSDVVSIIDVGDSKSEQDADMIKRDETKRQRIERMPFGIRSVSGKGKLLIACEAEEIVVDQRGNEIFKRPFSRYYEITENRTTQISQSSFLSQLGKNLGKISGYEDFTYNEFVAAAWKKFDKDMKNASGKKTMLKHQQYFDKILKQMLESPDAGSYVISVLAFVRQKMLTNHQPYRKLIELHKEIDGNPDMNDEMIIKGLEKIKEKYGQMEYEKTISKPRILYSMMVTK